MMTSMAKLFNKKEAALGPGRKDMEHRLSEACGPN